MQAIVTNPSNVILNPEPIRKSWIRSGRPAAKGLKLGEAGPHLAHVLWSCEPGQFFYHYEVDEIVYIMEGKAHLVGEGHRLNVKAGDTVFFPAGASYDWTIKERIYKVAVISQQVPHSAGWALKILNKVYFALERRMCGFNSAPSHSNGETI